MDHFTIHCKMVQMDRVYDNLLTDHFRENRQMAFVTGPRQVGKTSDEILGVNREQFR